MLYETKIRKGDFILLPWFKANAMYKGMVLGCDYSIKELGLWKK